MSPPRKDAVILCPECGTENKVSSPFCTACKARLYKNGAPIVKENPKKAAARKAIRSFILTWIFLTIAVIVGLVIWPHAAIDIPAQADPSNQVERYLTEVRRRREAKIPMPRTAFSQKNLNAYFGKNNNPDINIYSGILLSESRVLLITNEPLGPFELSTRLILEPTEEEERTPFTVSKLWVGHLPLPIRYTKSWTIPLAKRFGLNLDEELWEEMTVLGVGSAGLVVDVKWENP